MGQQRKQSRAPELLFHTLKTTTFCPDEWDSLTIPFKNLGVSSPKDGELWRVNFCRDWDENKREREFRYTSWSPSGGNFHKTENFGYLYFKEASPAVKIVSFGDLPAGNIEVKGSLFNPAPKSLALQGDLLVSLAETGKKLKSKTVSPPPRSV